MGDMDSGPVVVRFYLDQELVPLPGGERTITNIGANGTGQTSATLFATPVPATHTVYVKLNCTGDSNTVNNQAQKTFTVTVGGTLDVTSQLDPATCRPGQVFFVNGTVKLVGQPVSGAEVRITVKPAGTPVTTTTAADGRFTANLTAPSASGRYELESSASSGSVKGNDTKTLTVVLADILITELAFSSASPKEGDTVQLTATIRNNGTDSAEKVEVAFYSDNTKLQTKTVEPLGAGNVTQVSVGWKAVKGNHTMKALADPDNRLAEVTKDNNALTAPLNVRGGDGGGGIDMTVVIIVAVMAVAAVAAAGVWMMRRRKKK
jgi:uncharacterized repeat protein (TIGR01451 family)